MEGKMKVAVMNGIGEMGFVEREIPKPAADEVLVKLEYVGICGSDMHYYETGAIGDYVVEPPFVLGHEPGGVVVEVGENVKHLQVGDRVALEPGKTCGHCEFCKQGKYNLCKYLRGCVDRAFGSRFPCSDPGRCTFGTESSCYGCRMYRSCVYDGIKGKRCIRGIRC